MKLEDTITCRVYWRAVQEAFGPMTTPAEVMRFVGARFSHCQSSDIAESTVFYDVERASVPIPQPRWLEIIDNQGRVVR